MKQNYNNHISLEDIYCINVAEKGRYIIQECTDSQNPKSSHFYVLWDKNKREHVKKNDEIVLYFSKEKAIENIPDIIDNFDSYEIDVY